MQHAVTPWTATVQQDIKNSKPLWEISLCGYSLTIHNTGDSIWLTATWRRAGSMGFRLAFGMNSYFKNVAVNAIDKEILITASTRLGSYRIHLSFPVAGEAVFRYTTTLRVLNPLLIPFWPRDIVPLTKEGDVTNTAGKIHAHQVGARSGLLFFSMTKPKNGSVFYFQNLSALSDYCQACETQVDETVGGDWPEVGFQFPVNSEKPLPSNTEFIISDAFVLLSDQIPEKDHEIAAQFLDSLAAIYQLIPKPQNQDHNWPAIAKKTLADLDQNKGCWQQVNETAYLNAYVGDYKTPAEIMVQLSVLLPLQEYLEWAGENHQIADELYKGIEAFYDEQVKCLVRWHPAQEGDLDRSEEQKQEMVMDSWYLHHPLHNLCRLALRGHKEAKELFMKSIDFAIRVAHHFDYEWPVFYKMTTLEVIKAETEPGKGGEKDVPGSYAHLMLMACQLTHDKKYLNEAKKAVEQLKGLGLDIFYQANNTAFAAGALVELYKETQQERYLELSYCCLAGLFKNMQLWECNYGHGRNFPGFFSVFPLNDAPYTAAYEEMEVFAAFHHYLSVSEGIEILPSVKILMAEFVKYTTGRLAFYYPDMLPEDMLSEDVKTGEIKKGIRVPLEDIYAGWDKSGQVGQEVYGTGLPFGIVPRQYFQLKEIGALAFVDYPVLTLHKDKNAMRFKMMGHGSCEASLSIRFNAKAGKIKVEIKTGNKYNELQPSNKKSRKYTFAGDAIVRLSW